MSITTKGSFEASYPDALAVYCSDGRFTAAVDELLEHLGHPRLDTLTIPGGPGLLNHKTSGYSDCDTFSRSAEFLIREHTITTVATGRAPRPRPPHCRAPASATARCGSSRP